MENGDRNLKLCFKITIKEVIVVNTSQIWGYLYERSLLLFI